MIKTCVFLAKNCLIWIYTVFYAYTWPFKIIDNMVYYTPPQVSGGVLCFHVGCPCVCPSVRSLYVRPSVRTSFPFDSLSNYKRISFKFCICICTNNVSLGIVNGQISIIYHRVMALVNVYKWFLASSSFTICSIMMKRRKIEVRKALY